MLKILLFLTTFPFKHRQITIVLLMAASVLLFKYYELAPTGEKKNLNVGPFVVSLNMVHLQRRVDKPVLETAVMYPPAGEIQKSNGAVISSNNGSTSGQADAIAPSLPLNAAVDIQSAPENPVDSAAVDPYSQFQTLVGVSMTPPPALKRESIRAATVCLNNIDANRFGESPVQKTLVAVAESCDLLAIQGIYDKNLDLIRRWVDELNQRGSEYGFLGNNNYSPNNCQRLAFIFNRQVLAADRSQLIFLDTQNQLEGMPVAALFQARGTTSDRAFTFAAINVRIPVEKAPEAMRLTMDLFGAVSRTIVGEDDLIFMGDMGININRRSDFMYNTNLFWVWNKRSDCYFNRPMTENILFYKDTNREYREEYDLMDIRSLAGVTEEQLAEILALPPLWASFQIEEQK